MVDELCFVKSLWTEAINHDPAMTFLQTGSQIAGRPSLGSWVTYGLGSENENLPGFVVLVTKKPTDQPLASRLWGTGFMDSRYQGVRFSSGKDAVFYLSDPDGVCRSGRRALLDKLSALNKIDFQNELDPEIETRISQYEMAFRMQTSVPEVTDIGGEPQSIKDLYGPDAQKPGTFAANCLLARRLAESGVRFIQLYHPGWDQHGNLPNDIRNQAKETDQGCAALITDLKQRGMLEDTLVVWGGEFGRTAYSQGALTNTNYGRDHHPRCFTAWMAGGGVKPGITYGCDRRLRLQHRGFRWQSHSKTIQRRQNSGRRARPRLPRHYSQPTRHRPHPPLPYLPRSPLPPHRRPRPRGGGVVSLNKLLAAVTSPPGSRITSPTLLRLSVCYGP